MTIKTPRKTQGGFTLIELLVVIGILAILLAITLIALNPNQHFQNARNAQRQSDVAAILDSIYEYESANKGTLPAALTNVTTSPKHIAAPASTSLIDLCSLAPTYIADLPKDPSTGTVTGGSTPCATGTTAYDTGYTIATNASGNRYTIAAPSAENGATITVTK